MWESACSGSDGQQVLGSESVESAVSRADFQARPSCSRLVQSRFEYLPGWRPHSFTGPVPELQCTQEEEFSLYGQSIFPLLQLVPVVFCPFAVCLCE